MPRVARLRLARMVAVMLPTELARSRTSRACRVSCGVRGCCLHVLCVRVSVRSHKGLEACASRALPLLSAKRLCLLQLICIPNNVMATQREGHFLWISFLAIGVTSPFEREVGRGGRLTGGPWTRLASLTESMRRPRAVGREHSQGAGRTGRTHERMLGVKASWIGR